MGSVERDNGGGRKGKMKSNDTRKNKRRQKKLSAVQKLYETCKEVFADCGPDVVPSPDKVERLAAVLDEITEADVGLRPNMLYFSRERAPIITYLHLYECQKFSIGIFCLPPTSVIPLHSHPGMTVFGKLLFGTMHIRSYDWSNDLDRNNNDPSASNLTDPRFPPNNGLRLVKLKENSEFTAPCRTSILYPSDGGNMHRFTARTACAVLDVLGPPYCDADGRHCQYYNDLPFSYFPDVNDEMVSEEDREGYAWLRERARPEDLSVVGAPYNGPKITRK